MKIGINLVGVSHNPIGRVRTYTDSYGSFIEHIITPLKDDGHDLSFHLTTYDNEKRDEIIKDFNPKNYTFLDKNLAMLGGGDLIESNGRRMGIMMYTYLTSLIQLREESDLDLVISTRFDIFWKMNPLKKFNFDFSKFNFLFRDIMPGSPDLYRELPMVCDTFYIFPFHMIDKFILAILELIDNPYQGICIGMLNMHNPVLNNIGEKNINIVCEEFLRSDYNYIYDLKRKE